MERIHSLIFEKQITLSIHFKYTHNRRLWVQVFFLSKDFFLRVKSYLLYLFLDMLNENEIIEMLIICYIGLFKTENQS